MKTAVNSSASASSWRQAEHSFFDFVHAVCGFAGLAGVRDRSLCVQRFSFQHLPPAMRVSTSSDSPEFAIAHAAFSFTKILLFPTSGPATGSFKPSRQKQVSSSQLSNVTGFSQATPAGRGGFPSSARVALQFRLGPIGLPTGPRATSFGNVNHLQYQ
jgi:hypothetical protein